MATLAEKGKFFLALIGDLQASRASENRSLLQQRLETGLQRINRRHAADRAARFVVTLGDEFQGLLHEPRALMRLITSLDESLRGLAIRYGVGWGGLSTPLKPDAIGMDGPCFHAARAALQRSKREKRWLTVCGFGDEEDTILNSLFGLMGALRSQWTVRQTEAVATRRRTKTLKEAARMLDIQEPTLHKALKAAHYTTLCEAEKAMATLLERFAIAPATPPGDEERRP